MKVPFNDLYANYCSIKQEIDGAIANVIRDTAFIKGAYGDTFEREFSQWCGGEHHFVGCANGTDAIELALQALGVGPGDEVIVPANTWISTAEAVTTVGASVVFVDNHPTKYTIDVTKIREKITKKTKAIIPVHLYGLPADMEEIMALATEFSLRVIEDTAQGHGARLKGKMVGTFGDAATYSFFPGKNLGAFGDAGGVLCKDPAVAEKIRQLGNHGRLGKFDHAFEGRNSRLDGLQAAILSAKLPHLASWTKRRQEIAQQYLSLLQSDSRIQIPEIPDGYEHVFHLFVVQIEQRDQVRERLEKAGIQTGIQYPIALPLLKAYARLGHMAEDFPVASRGMNRILSLPIYPEMTSAQVEYVCATLQECLPKGTLCVESQEYSHSIKPLSGANSNVLPVACSTAAQTPGRST